MFKNFFTFLMLKNILVCIVILIIVYQIYLNNAHSKSSYTDDVEYDDETDDETTATQTDVNTIVKKELPILKPFGRAHLSSVDNDGTYYIWNFVQHKPWSKITLRPGKDFPFIFYLKINKIPSSKYNEWKDIIPNINFNSNTGNIIIPSRDEEGALSVSNLMLNHFNGKLTLDDIISRNLIPLSVSKAKAVPLVKEKLREQIIETLQQNINTDTNNKKLNSRVNFVEDLATKPVLQSGESGGSGNFGPVAFGGREYTFIN